MHTATVVLSNVLADNTVQNLIILLRPHKRIQLQRTSFQTRWHTPSLLQKNEGSNYHRNQRGKTALNVFLRTRYTRHRRHDRADTRRW